MAAKPRYSTYVEPAHRGWSNIREGISTGQIKPDAGVKLLERRGRDGLLAAGQLGIQLAMAGGSTDEVTDRLGRARNNFNNVVDYRAMRYTDDVVARARLYLAQMPVYVAVSSTQCLPVQRPARLAYDATVVLGASLSEDFEGMRAEASPEFVEPIKQLAGVIAKVSALGLAQRYPVKKEITKKWFPILMSYTDGYIENACVQTRRPYDINFYTSGSFDVEPNRRAHVVSNQKPAERSSSDDNDIKQVSIGEDLRLGNGVMLVTTIPTELAAEAVGTSPESSVCLDLRMKKLLKALRLAV